MAAGKRTHTGLCCGVQLLCLAIVVCLLLTSCIGVEARKNPKPPRPSRPPPSPKGKRANRKASPSPIPPPTPAPTPEPTPPPVVPVPEPSPESNAEVMKKDSAVVSDSINISQGGWGCEENVCNAAGQCGSGARAEVLVTPTHAGEATWAPLCAPDALNETFQWTLAYVVCNQFYDWPTFENFRQNPNGLASVFGWRQEPLLIPAEAPAEGATDEYGSPLFDPSKYTHWATVTGWADVATPLDVRSVQQLQLQISTTPCAEGRMFSVYCSLTVADRHRHQ